MIHPKGSERERERERGGGGEVDNKYSYSLHGNLQKLELKTLKLMDKLASTSMYIHVHHVTDCDTKLVWHNIPVIFSQK